MSEIRPYYLNQTGWTSDDYYGLHRYLHRLFLHYDKRKDEIYSEEVKKFINEISVEEELEDDWLNNDSYNLEEVMGIFNEIQWIEDNSYSNIKLFVATSESMLKLKIRAVHFGGLVPRVTDQMDFLDLLGSLGIHNIEELDRHDITKDMKERYPRSYAFLKEQENW